MECILYEYWTPLLGGLYVALSLECMSFEYILIMLRVSSHKNKRDSAEIFKNPDYFNLNIRKMRPIKTQNLTYITHLRVETLQNPINSFPTNLTHFCVYPKPGQQLKFPKQSPNQWQIGDIFT